MKTAEEIWIDIDEFDKLYSISNYGNIRSNKNKQIHIRKPSKDNKGYSVITLKFNGQQKTKKIHRLVAQAFIPNPHNKLTVNHIDGNKSNNHFTNLEWATNAENNLHARKNGLIERYYPREYLGFNVIDSKTNKIYKSIGESARDINMHRSTLSRMLRGIYENKTTFKLIELK